MILLLGLLRGRFLKKFEKHCYEMESDPVKAERELGRILIILGKHFENIQSQVLGSFYNSYVTGEISWGKFCELSEANCRMFISDYHILQEAACNGGININDRELYQVDCLISLGLLQNKNRLGGTVIIDFDDEIAQEYDIR